LLVYCFGELAQVSAKGTQEPLDREPLHAASSSLYARDVGRVHLKEPGELLLRYARPVAQRAERAAKGDQVGVSGLIVHGGPWVGIRGQVSLCSDRPT
jgi:hypothetical protein